LWHSDRAKLPQECLSSFVYERCQFLLMIRKEEKWTRGGELLPLEQHRRTWSEQKERRHSAIPTGAAQGMAAQSAGRIGDLIMVLDKRHKCCRFEAKGRRPPGLLLPPVPLALIQIPPLHG
jgi:hypothetical protein